MALDGVPAGARVFDCLRDVGPVAHDYLLSASPVNIIQGPVGSAKSSTSAMKLYVAMCTMPRWRDGKRRSRWLISRNTYPDLRGSTVETWLYWFPPSVYGKFTETEPYMHEMRFMDVEADVIFESYADDKIETIKSLRSKEYTGAWYNEAQFAPRRLISEISDRTGRYPPQVEIAHALPPGRGLPKFMLCDLNAPEVDDHWILRMRGDSPIPVEMPPEEARQYEKPPGWRFFKQPPALTEVMAADGQSVVGYEVNPAAENIKNMTDGVRSTIEAELAVGRGEEPLLHRYVELVGGKTKDEIDRDLLCRVSRVKRGAPATPGFRRERHVGPANMLPMEGVTVVLGADHGLTPACVFLQEIAGRWVAFDELVASNKTTDEFAPLVRMKLRTRFPGCDQYAAWGDPAGDWQGQAVRGTPFQIYRAHGVMMRAPALKDNPSARLAAVRKVLATEHNNLPRLLVHPRCKMLIAALEGDAQVRKVKAGDGMRLTEELIKNAASHVFEAVTYALWGGGEVREVLTGSAERARPVNTIARRRIGFRFSAPGRR